MGEIAGLYWEERGPAGGPPVILSPGLGGSAAYWAPNLDALLEHRRVILYDHRGTGRSDRTLPPKLSVDDMVDDVLALMDGLGVERADLLGHAAGGVVGLALALRTPERLDRLTIVNGFAKADPHFIRCMETRLALLHGSGVEAFVRAQPFFLYPARWISEHWQRLLDEETGLIQHFQGAANIEARISALAAFDVKDRLHDLVTPTLLISAQDDMLVPDLCSERIMAADRPAVSHVSMTGGHACNVTQPAIFNELMVAWLREP